jgi:hypothetical protein
MVNKGKEKKTHIFQGRNNHGVGAKIITVITSL